MKLRRTLFAPVTLLLALLLLGSPSSGQAARLSVASVFGDHMVLQRETQAAIWGRAQPEMLVTIEASWGGQPVTSAADASGRWLAKLPTPAAGGPHRIVISSSAGERIEFLDVMSGEVWICSGQSNMEWPLRAIVGADFEISSELMGALRLFDVPHQVAMEPSEDCAGEWRLCTPESVADFSAVAFFFARELHTALHVPIGLIASNWGGTVVESWTSEASLRRGFPEFDAALDRVHGALLNPEGVDSGEALRAAWWKHLEALEPGMQQGWMQASTKTDDWKTAGLPGTWEQLGLGNFDGCLWYRRDLELPGSFVGRDLLLELGPIDDMDLTWFNGRLVGATQSAGFHATPRSYSIPAGVSRAGQNTIVVCAVDTGGEGRLGREAEGMRLRAVDPGELGSLELAGEWQTKRGAPLSELGAFPNPAWFHANYPTALSNGMLEPLVPYSIKGAIWYQGESNVPRASQYRRLFPALINDWRQRFEQGPFPFYFVQIAPFEYGGDMGQAAELREAQALALSLENTGMAVTMDIGNPHDIHPRDKESVGERLALWALAKDYGLEELPYSGPLYSAMQVARDAIILSFEHAAGLNSGDSAPSHFSIAGADRKFQPATARIEGTTIIVHSKQVPAPLAVRFAWGAADQPNLRNSAGLPAASFRTDDWPAVSREQ